MKLSKRMIKFLEECTDKNGYMAIYSNNACANSPAVLLRFCEEEGYEPAIFLHADLGNCLLHGFTLFEVFDKETLEDQNNKQNTHKGWLKKDKWFNALCKASKELEGKYAEGTT